MGDSLNNQDRISYNFINCSLSLLSSSFGETKQGLIVVMAEVTESVGQLINNL